MSQTISTERPSRVRVSTISHSRSVRETKSFNLPPVINVTKIRRFHSFSNNPVTPENNVADAINDAHHSRHIIHIKVLSHNSIKQSFKNNEVEPLQADTLKTNTFEMNTKDRSQSMKTKRVNVKKIYRKRSQEEMRTDRLKTTTDVDSKLTQESSVHKNEIKLKTKNQNKVWKNFHNDPNVNINQILLSRLPNYQNSRLFTNLDNERNAWPRELESISFDASGRLKKKDEKKNAELKRRRCLICSSCSCSPCCAVLSVFIIMILLAALGALLVALIGTNKKTNTTILTTSATITTTTSSTAMTATTTTTTSSTTTTSTTTSTTSLTTTTSTTTTTTTTTSSTTTTSTTTTTTSITTSTTTSTTTSVTTSTTATTTTSTTSTTTSVTTATTTSTTTATTSTTTSVTTTTTSTTTTAFTCGQSCLNQSWIQSSDILAVWPFDDSYDDMTGTYDATPTPSGNPPTFVTGYLGQAASFNASAEQAMYTSFIPLNNVSFTVGAWIQPTGYPNPEDHDIVGLCKSTTTDYCLHIVIRYRKLYFGFYGDDCSGTTILLLNQWIHVAFVFDLTKMTKTIYLNGFQNNGLCTSNVLRVQSVNFTIGTSLVYTPNNYFQGYIDQLSISQRAQSSCEILQRATLAAEFKFDTPSPYADSGPNSVPTNYSDTSIITGYQNQAISFTGSLSSYFQAWGFTSLGVSNQSFSITLWIQPQILSGTLVHLSTSSLGTGSTCFPLLGFASNGAIVAQVLTDNSTIVTAIGPILPISSSWNLIAQTWSSTDGLKLYVNDTVVSSVSASSFLGSGTTPNYLTLGNCLSGCGVCSNGSVSEPGPFTGATDDWRIYSRELSWSDICTLYIYT